MASRLDLIKDAIECATKERLQETLLSIVTSDEYVLAKVEKKLLVSAPSNAAEPRSRGPGDASGSEDVIDITDTSGDEVSVDAPPPVTAKRKRYEKCSQCRREFDTTTNTARRCRWHEGRLEPDYQSDFWADHDEDCHGVIDSREMRKEFPEGFIWTCCKKTGKDKGCCIGRHIPSQVTVKQRRRK